MYEIVKIQMHFQLIHLIILLTSFFNRCVDLGKIFKNEIYLFSFEQNMKRKIMVKIRYFCINKNDVE
jgi:hypothetical protein